MRAVRCARDAALACACRPRALRARPRFARAAPFPSSLPGFSTLCARLRRVRLSPLSQDRHRSAGPTGEAPSALRRARPSGGEIDIGPAWRAGPAYINLGPTEKSVRNGHETAFWHGIGSKSGCVRSTDSRDLGFFWQTLIRMTNSVPERGFMAIFAPDSRTRGGDGLGRDPFMRSGACPNAGCAWFGRVRARTSSLLDRGRQRPGRSAEQGPSDAVEGPVRWTGARSARSQGACPLQRFSFLLCSGIVAGFQLLARPVIGSRFADWGGQREGFQRPIRPESVAI